MAIKILERLYSEIYTDGLTDWMLANVGEWQKLKLKCEVAIEFLGSQQSPIEIDYVNNAFIISSGSGWGSYGFDAGMVAVFSYKRSVDTTGDGEFDTISSVQRVYNITNIFDNTMEVEETIDVDGFDTIPTNFGSRKITEVLFYVSAIPEGCRITYGHITNNEFEAQQLNSFIDQTETEFAFAELNNLGLGVFGTMEPIGFQSGMSVRKVKVREVPNIVSGLLNNYTIPQQGLKNLRIWKNALILPDVYESIRSIPVSTENPSSLFQNVVSDDLIPQNGINGILNGNDFQAFLFDSPSASSNSYSFNGGFRITSKTGVFSTSSAVQIKILRYTNGASMNYVDQIVLKTFTNINNIINQNLTINDVFQIDVNQTESFVLAFQIIDTDLSTTTERNVDYIINDGGGFIISQDGESIVADYKRHFEFELEYMISSFFDQFSDLESQEIPTYLTGNGSLTDNFKIEFYPEWNNPNVVVENDMTKTKRLGNTGWFNENYNELPNDFQVESITYLDENANPVNSLDYSSVTKVQIVINGVLNLNANTECGFGFAWIPTDESDYKNKETPFYRNCFVQSGSTTDGFVLDQLYTETFFGGGLNGGSMDTSQIRFSNSSGKIVMEANFIPNASFFNIFDAKNENDRNYILWVSVADGSLERNFSDRVSLIADTGSMVKSIPPAGSYDQIDNSFIEHPFDETNAGVESLQGIIQDDILCRMPLRIPTDGSKVFQRIAFGVEIFNIGLNQSFELERYDIDLTQFPITSDGVQQINIDTIRGFKLEPGNNKNFVKIQRNTSLDTVGFAGFICLYGTKIRWEDWLLNSNTPNAFFDPNQLNNGFNNDWYDYLITEGWSIKYFAEIISNESGDLFEYKNQWNMNFRDYDQNVNIATTHKYFRNSDNTLLNIGTDVGTGRPLGVIISNEPTRIEIEFEILDSGIWDLSKTYGVITIEIDRGAGRFEQRQLSSVWGSENDNPLFPLPSETKLKIEVDGTNKFLKLSSLIDPDLLDDSDRYRITGRVGCMDENDGGNVFEPGLYEFVYENLYE
jgi:hypothetical protein